MRDKAQLELQKLREQLEQERQHSHGLRAELTNLREFIRELPSPSNTEERLRKAGVYSVDFGTEVTILFVWRKPAGVEQDSITAPTLEQALALAEERLKP